MKNIIKWGVRVVLVVLTMAVIIDAITLSVLMSGLASAVSGYSFQEGGVLDNTSLLSGKSFHRINTI
jgi:hypothetical protein